MCIALCNVQCCARAAACEPQLLCSPLPRHDTALVTCPPRPPSPAGARHELSGRVAARPAERGVAAAARGGAPRRRRRQAATARARLRCCNRKKAQPGHRPHTENLGGQGLNGSRGAVWQGRQVLTRTRRWCPTLRIHQTWPVRSHGPLRPLPRGVCCTRAACGAATSPAISPMRIHVVAHPSQHLELGEGGKISCNSQAHQPVISMPGASSVRPPKRRSGVGP